MRSYRPFLPFYMLGVFVALFLVSLQPVFAQLPAPEETAIVGAHMPAVSPDGSHVAFVWRGDIWVAPSNGGGGYRVTDHLELDAYPVFSPDGKWIAFSSQRNGNWDIFVVPTIGGAARQMTFSGGSEIVTDWSPDGKTLLFAGRRDTVNSTIFALDVATLRFKKVTEDYMPLANPAFSPDGGKIVFQRSGFPWTRPRYHGSGAAHLWTIDLGAGKRTAIAENELQHLWAHYLPDGKSIVAVTVAKPTPNAQYLNKPALKLVDNEQLTPNLFLFPASGAGTPKQLTHFVGGSVRWPNVARKSGDIVFEHEQDLYLLKNGSDTPQKLTFYCAADDKQNNNLRQSFTNSDATESEVSPDGKTFAFVLKNDIWTIPVEKPKNNRNADDAKRLTDWAGFDRDFGWGKDNKTIYFVSDREGNDRIYSVNVTSANPTATPIWTGKADARAPQVSPDGSLVGFWVRGSVTQKTGGLYVKATNGTGESKLLIALPSAVQGEFAWSPDGKWIAYTREGLENAGTNIYITPADGTGKAVNVTRLNSSHRMPVWSPDGRFLFFTSDRDGNGLYVLPLKQEDARNDDLGEMKFEAPKTPVAITIDFEDTAQRIRKISTQAIDSDLSIVSATGTLYFVSGGDAYSASYDGKTITKLTNGGNVGSLRVSTDGKTLFYRKNGSLYTQKAEANAAPTQVVFTAKWERDVRAERLAAFNEFWRSYNTNFYDPNFHGRDWSAIRARYQPLLDGVGTRHEFATLLNMMVGELEASHSEVGPAPDPIPAPVARNLGVYFDYEYEGPGVKVRAVPKRAPGSYAKTRIKVGDYILAVDGKDVTLDENLYKVLNDKGDRDFELTVNNKATKEGARTVRYRALTDGEWDDIHYRNRTEMLRRRTSQKSDDRIAYVHIQGMGLDNRTTFDREFFEYAEGKDAVIIDVRFNGGGNIADTLIGWLGIKPYSTYVPRDGYAFNGPPPWTGNHAWSKPIIVLMNERSFSNAEMFPYGMRAAGIAKLVGMPTPGYVIWTGGLNLVDGTRARMPGSGSFRKDGSPAENQGEKPDYTVPLSNEDWLYERDPQLDKAIELLRSGQVKR